MEFPAACAGTAFSGLSIVCPTQKPRHLTPDDFRCVAVGVASVLRFSVFTSPRVSKSSLLNLFACYWDEPHIEWQTLGQILPLQPADLRQVRLHDRLGETLVFMMHTLHVTGVHPPMVRTAPRDTAGLAGKRWRRRSWRERWRGAPWM